MRVQRAFMGLGHTSARRGALVWLGPPVEPRAPFMAERLVLDAIDGRRWGLSPWEVPAGLDVLEVNGIRRQLAGPAFPMRLQPGEAIRFGVQWRDDGAYQLAGGLYGWFEVPDPPFRYDARHNPALMQPPGMRSFVVHDLGEIPGPEGSETLTYDEVESAFLTEWNRVLTPICGPEWWALPRPAGWPAGKTKALA